MPFSVAKKHKRANKKAVTKKDCKKKDTCWKYKTSKRRHILIFIYLLVPPTPPHPVYVHRWLGKQGKCWLWRCECTLMIWQIHKYWYLVLLNIPANVTWYVISWEGIGRLTYLSDGRELGHPLFFAVLFFQFRRQKETVWVPIQWCFFIFI